MNNISQIILNVLEANDGCALDNAEERAFVADRVAKVLIQNSLAQLAVLLDGSIETDLDGRAVIYTDLVLGEI